MTAALRAVDLGPRHPVAAIHGGANRPRMRRHETGPASARLELRLVREQLLSAAGAGKRARPLLGEQRAAAGPLRRVMTQDLVLLRRQNPLPLLVSLLNGKISHSPT